MWDLFSVLTPLFVSPFLPYFPPSVLIPHSASSPATRLPSCWSPLWLCLGHCQTSGVLNFRYWYFLVQEILFGIFSTLIYSFLCLPVACKYLSSFPYISLFCSLCQSRVGSAAFLSPFLLFFPLAVTRVHCFPECCAVCCCVFCFWFICGNSLW